MKRSWIIPLLFLLAMFPRVQAQAVAVETVEIVGIDDIGIAVFDVMPLPQWAVNSRTR